MKSNRLGLAMILVSGFAGAQAPGDPASAAAASDAGPASVRAGGDGVVYAQPDQARIDIGVVTRAPTAQAAGAQNAARSQALLDCLHALLGPKADIRTISYSLDPNYRRPPAGGKPAANGYTAVNTLEITSHDLAGIGRTIHAASAGGANRIQRLQFLLKDERPARAEALRQAALAARSHAQAMAEALGLKLGRVLALEHTGTEPIQPTPIQAEPIEVRASVTLTVALE
jgi:uncharacterized protein YggE